MHIRSEEGGDTLLNVTPLVKKKSSDCLEYFTDFKIVFILSVEKNGKYFFVSKIELRNIFKVLMNMTEKAKLA